ncbi:MAG TPA: response regulator [Micromonosporaceae bacterium]|nr:response regulator [Micromonosporaceae bacterium]
MTPVHALIVEDSEDDVLLIVLELRRGEVELTYQAVQTAQGVADALRARPPQVVISDYNMPSFSVEDTLRIIRESGLDIPLILVSGKVGEEVAATVMKAGAHDFVLKNRLNRLAPAVEREIREADERRQRRNAEAALRASEERFRLLAEHAQDIIFRYLVPDARLDYISPAVATVTGYRPTELYANSGIVFAMVEPEDRPRFEEAWRSSKPRDLVVRWRRRDGRLVWMEQRAVGISDSDGRLIAVEGILRDVTEQTLGNQERERLDRELRQAERLDSLGQLAGGIAHDFNNLLAVIMGFGGEVLEALGPSHPCRPDVVGINEAAERAAALTRQLLIFSRLEPSQAEILDLNAVVSQTEYLLRRTIGEDIEFRTVLQPGLSAVRIDRSKLEQVIVNLVVNARAAMPHGGQLRIETTACSSADAVPGAGLSRRVRLVITDTGSGMSPEVARRAFEPFFTTKAQGHGTGLGLATAYGVIKDAGGEITVDTEPGRGTTITVALPCVEFGEVKPVPPVATPAAGSGETILVVEDEAAVRDIVVRILGRSGYRVVPAATPMHALELFVHDDPHIDAVLTDVIMPEMSGPQLIERLVSLRPDLRYLLMSGYTAGSFPGGNPPNAELPLLRKPFTADALLEGIADVLAGATLTARPAAR